jgi:hypothetical protein
MTTAEAKRILLLHRPWLGTPTSAETAEALCQVERDVELKLWWENHLACQLDLRAKLRELPVPAHLKTALLAERKVIRPEFWQRPAVWLAAAAACALLIGVAGLMLQPRVPDRFTDFRSRMVRSALRQYSMDIVTNDMPSVRQFMAARGAPADYSLPPGLARLSLTGGAALKWRSTPVAMVCFDRGDQEMLYLFVMDRAVAKDAPPATPHLEKVNKLMTVSWSEGDRAYVLAGPDETDFAGKYL